VIPGDAFAYLVRTNPAPFDVIYIAPPQYKGLWLKALELVDARPELLSPDGVVIVQIFPKEWRDVDLAHLVQTDRRQYGSTALHFFKKDLTGVEDLSGLDTPPDSGRSEDDPVDRP
jgi:16S rRNA (guanine966-N2)-methyltransferase